VKNNKKFVFPHNKKETEKKRKMEEDFVITQHHDHRFAVRCIVAAGMQPEIQTFETRAEARDVWSWIYRHQNFHRVELVERKNGDAPWSVTATL
jgi:hypothetical protein